MSHRALMCGHSGSDRTDYAYPLELAPQGCCAVYLSTKVWKKADIIKEKLGKRRDEAKVLKHCAKIASLHNFTPALFPASAHFRTRLGEGTQKKTAMKWCFFD